MRNTLLPACLAIVLGLSGCFGSQQAQIQPPPPQRATYIGADMRKADYKDEQMEVSLSLVKDGTGSAVGFGLEIKNLTAKDITVDWNQSYFINKGSAGSGFFDGENYEERAAPKTRGWSCPKPRAQRISSPSPTWENPITAIPSPTTRTPSITEHTARIFTSRSAARRTG